MAEESILPGQLWAYRDGVRTGPHPGLCVVVRPNDSRESSDSYVMVMLPTRRRYYMHRSERRAGLWVRKTGPILVLEKLPGWAQFVESLQVGPE
jgi:hypothetical protein